MRAASMRAEQDLYKTVRNQLVQRQKLFVGFRNRRGVGSRRNAGAGLQRIGCLSNDRIFKGLACDLPECDESIDSVRKTDGEDAVIARRAQRLEVEIER